MVLSFSFGYSHETERANRVWFCTKQLARLLDRPLFPWKRVIVGFSLGQFILEGFLSLRQYKILQQKKPPKVLEGEVEQKVFDESQVRASKHTATEAPLYFPQLSLSEVIH